jgi:hypothetical protein
VPVGPGISPPVIVPATGPDRFLTDIVERLLDAAEVQELDRPLSGRLRLLRAVAWCMVAVSAVGLFGIVDLMTLPGWVDQRYVWAVSLEASWGSLLTFVVAGSCTQSRHCRCPGSNQTPATTLGGSSTGRFKVPRASPCSWLPSSWRGGLRAVRYGG